MRSEPTEAELRRRTWIRDHPAVFAAVVGTLSGAGCGLFLALRRGWSWGAFSMPLLIGVVLVGPAVWFLTRRALGDGDD